MFGLGEGDSEKGMLVSECGFEGIEVKESEIDEGLWGVLREIWRKGIVVGMEEEEVLVGDLGFYGGGGKNGLEVLVERIWWGGEGLGVGSEEG